MNCISKKKTKNTFDSPIFAFVLQLCQNIPRLLTTYCVQGTQIHPIIQIESLVRMHAILLVQILNQHTGLALKDPNEIFQNFKMESRCKDLSARMPLPAGTEKQPFV